MEEPETNSIINFEETPCAASLLNIGEWFSYWYPASDRFPPLQVIRKSKRGNLIVTGPDWNGYEIPISPHRRVYRQK